MTFSSDQSDSCCKKTYLRAFFGQVKCLLRGSKFAESWRRCLLVYWQHGSAQMSVSGKISRKMAWKSEYFFRLVNPTLHHALPPTHSPPPPPLLGKTKIQKKQFRLMQFRKLRVTTPWEQICKIKDKSFMKPSIFKMIPVLNKMIPQKGIILKICCCFKTKTLIFFL